MKIGCIIYAVGEVYELLSECAVKSFKKFHPDIPVHHITGENVNTFEVAKEFDKKYGGHHNIFRWGVVLEIWEKYEYDKVIMLGADTITCAYLTEFVESTEADAVLTLNEPYQLTMTHVPRNIKTGEYDDSLPIRSTYTPIFMHSEKYGLQLRFDSVNLDPLRSILSDPKGGVHRLEYTHCNADVVCFNNPECLRATHDYYFRYMEDYEFSTKNFEMLKQGKGPPGGLRVSMECYNEQGALNMLATLSMAQELGAYEKLFVEPAPSYGFDKLLGYRVVIADSPRGGGCLYNVRSKKNILALRVEENLQKSQFPWSWRPCECQSIRQFKVDDKKLYTADGHQIKMWHYGTGLGETNGGGINSFIYYKFNRETKEFFKNECDCGDFFEKPFIV